MRGPRFFLALYLAKILSRVISLLAKGRGTNLPGAVALKIDPAFLSHVRGIDPEKTIFITGTNGKSTTTNLLADALQAAGYRITANLQGANMTAGVAVPLIRDCSLAGRIHSDFVVMETDERYLSRILAQIPAKYLCVTNIQKDQVQRNGEPNFIRRKIRAAIRPDMTVFLNHDEPNSRSLEDLGRRTVRYSVEPNRESYQKNDDFFSVSIPCPRCHAGLKFQVHNIENVGRFRCPGCGFGAGQEADYTAGDIDYDRECFSLDGTVYPFHYNVPQFLYSYVAAAAICDELGVDRQAVVRGFDQFTHFDRVETKTIGGRQVSFFKMKQENSETLQTVLDTIAEDPEEKVFLLGCDEYIDFYPPYLNTCFLFDCDFRSLRDSGVARWAVLSKGNGHAAAVRLLYDGLDPKRMEVLPDDLEPGLSAYLARTDCDNVYLVEEIPYWKRV